MGAAGCGGWLDVKCDAFQHRVNGCDWEWIKYDEVKTPFGQYDFGCNMFKRAWLPVAHDALPNCCRPAISSEARFENDADSAHENGRLSRCVDHNEPWVFGVVPWLI